MPPVILDALDIRLLDTLQDDGRLTNVDLAERIGLSASPCWRRLRRLEEAGVIKGYQAILDRKTLGFGVTAFISVVIESHNESDAKAFEKAVMDLPEIVGCHSVSGQADFMLQVVSDDLDSYADFAMNVVRRLPGIKEMHTSFALKEIKATPKLPIGRRSGGSEKPVNG
jgi:DNA-binding Lrp family transcriptional regulator